MNKKIDFTTHFFIWSVVLEFLVYFIMTGQQFLGISVKLSRIVQILFIAWLVMRNSSEKLLFFAKEIFLLRNFPYWIYIFYGIVVGIFGLVFGYYDKFTNIISINETMFSFQADCQRLFIEYLISIYYFLYFAVFPPIFLNSREKIQHFFKIFFIVFWSSFFLGCLDYLIYYQFNYDLIGRHFYDGRDIGLRFHGLAGEPRDAFVFLIFGMVMLILDSSFKNKKDNKFLIPKLCLCFPFPFLTQSASGIIGLAFSSFLILLFLIASLQMKKFLQIFVVLGGIALISMYSITHFSRLDMIFGELNVLYQSLSNNLAVNEVIYPQMSNIYPFWYRWNEILHLNILPTLFGTGIGSSAIVNSYFFGEQINPFCDSARIFYDTGLLGTLLFIYAFISPIFKRVQNTGHEYLVSSMLLLLGVTFAHRSAATFVFLGIFIAVSDHYSFPQKRWHINIFSLFNSDIVNYNDEQVMLK